MTHDPFDALRRQLAAAVAARPAPLKGRRRRWLAGLLALLVVGAGGTVAAALLRGPDADEQVQRALAAGSAASESVPACGAAPRPGRARLIPGPVPAWVTTDLAVLRRPVRARDQATLRQLSIGGEDVYRESVHVARAANGSRFLIYVSRGTFLPGPTRDPIACERGRRAAAMATLGTDDTFARARVAEIYEGRIRAQRELEEGRVRFTLTVAELTSEGRIGGAGATVLVKGHRLPAMGSIGPDAYSGVVPDDVVRIRLIDASGSPRAAPVETSVRDNVFSFALPARMGRKMVAEWLDKDGRVLRRIHPRY